LTALFAVIIILSVYILFHQGRLLRAFGAAEESLGELEGLIRKRMDFYAENPNLPETDLWEGIRELSENYRDAEQELLFSANVELDERLADEKNASMDAEAAFESQFKTAYQKYGERYGAYNRTISQMPGRLLAKILIPKGSALICVDQNSL
jgi:hypothetical protein